MRDIRLSSVARKVVVLDSHAFNDNRISKHIASAGAAYPVFRVNFNFYPDLNPRSPDESRSRVYHRNSGKNPMVNGMRFTLNNTFGSFPREVAGSLERGFIGSADQVIFHVHDPYVLSLAHKLHRYFPRSCIVYDRHEYYDAWKNWTGFSAPGLLERVYGKHADEFVVVSHYRKEYPSFIGKKKVTVIPNYPKTDKFLEGPVREKVDSFDGKAVEFVYFGALNLNFDRDIPLMLWLAEGLMAADERVRITIAGRIYHQDIQPMLSRLEQKFPNRMRYLGEVPYKEVVDLTQKAHLGFLLLDPDNPMFSEEMPNSSNKVYEYLLSGTVPIVRGVIEDAEAVSSCSLVFGRGATKEQMLKAILDLVQDQDRLRKAMQKCYETGLRFSWDDVSKGYLEMYERIFRSMDEADRTEQAH